MLNIHSHSKSDNRSKGRTNISTINKKIDERYFKRLNFLLIIVLSAFSSWTVFLEQYPQSISFDKAILALLATWLCFYPSIQYLSDPKRPPIPFFPLVGLFYALSFSLPIFRADDVEVYSIFSLKDVTQESLILLVMGLANMNIAFFLSRKYWWKNINPIRLPTITKASSFLILAWLFLSMYLSYVYVSFLQDIPSIGHFLTPLGYFSFGLFYILWSEKKLSKLQMSLVLGLFILELVFRLATGALAQIVFFLLFLVLVLWRQHKRLPLTIMLITAIFFLLFNPVKGEYRSYAWNNTGDEMGTLEKAQLFINLAVDYYSNPDNSPSTETESRSIIEDSIINRVSQIALLSKVVEDTPDRVPHWNGQSYSSLWTSFVPRILWPNKPTAAWGNIFGRVYGYLNRYDYTTSLNLPWIVEMYINFGDIGIFLGMALVGLLLGFLDKIFNFNGMNDLEFLFGCVILFGLTRHLSNFALDAGGIFLTSVTIYVAIKFLIISLELNANR
jgi:hypothetical protein